MRLQSLKMDTSLRVLAFCAVATITMSAQTFISLLDFQPTIGVGPENLVQYTDGDFYGTTAAGGANDKGTLFRITPAGKLTTLYSFCAQTKCTDGASPGQLVLGNDGNFYGFTASGGANCQELSNPGCGTVFKMTPTGSLTTLYSFCVRTNCADGWTPDALVQGADGNFYGTTFTGGPNNSNQGGEVFKLTPAGVLTLLYGFCSQTDCTDGEIPTILIQAANGNFYGSTEEGGATGCGTAFTLTRRGQLNTLYNFTRVENCGGGFTGIMQGSDGNFYGTTPAGGSHGHGTVFKMTPSGAFGALYSFCAQTNCADGENPHSGVVEDAAGNFYGTTAGSLNHNNPNYGTIFQLTPSGTLNTLHSFDYTDGALPGEITLATSGIFYGTTSYGGITDCFDGCGTVYSISTGLGPFVEASPNYGASGRVVKILGDNLTGTTSVTFNGISATFKVISSTYIKAMVPSGATTGPIVVTTPSGILNSNVAFQVLP
jgi:uncharacterized repeat protein (TIGR03803 family)